ncbi:SCO3242 family prenyltransferase [Streptomyces sp. NBC_00439]|uniref:SCO3242 family prenyltransferase n=1 Tax=Streptomyces sp. NBC_00439 TaxID=2903650 RepID=UPI002253BA58|nr:UbiA family prenyltransferase [Streptomyces sp. NBC_00439]MCX5104620.1 UbiA family prenyltransferase [Streptomyces sp. NBC_00439]
MTARAWAELLRVSALFTVPGDALAGAAASGRRPNGSTALAVGASLCLYEAGMALNDWADRAEDAVDRPHRPIPSGRIAPGAALAAAGALTAAGLGLAARAGRPALAVATGLAATVWAYDLRLKHTPAGPAAMAAARGLDLLLGATATGAAVRTTGPGAGPDPAARGSVLGALPAAGLLGAHTYAVTAVSRHEAHGGSTTAPLAALAAVTALGAAALHTRRARGGEPGTARGTTARTENGRDGERGTAPGVTAQTERARGGEPGTAPETTAQTRRERRGASGAAPRMRSGRGGDRSLPRPAHRPPAPLAVTAPGFLVRTALTGSYVRTAAVPLLHAALNPSPPLTQRAVGGGIRAMIPLQAALAARTGAVGTALAVMGLVPIARTLARKVSPT